jgi:8-oxo-dGTP pyrophosphatase MutT (NUDIX family)
MKYYECAGGIVFNMSNQVIMIKQVGGSWSLPKGHIDKGESPEITAIREIYEESGITDLTLVKYIGSYTRTAIRTDGTFDEKKIKKIHVFLFRTMSNELRPQLSDSLEAKWTDKEEVYDLLTHPADKEYFKSILKVI